MYDTCVNDEQNSSRQGRIVVYTDVENASEDLDPEGVKFSPWGQIWEIRPPAGVQIENPKKGLVPSDKT